MALPVAFGCCFAFAAVCSSAEAAMTCTYEPFTRSVIASTDASHTDPVGGVYRDGDQIMVTFNQPCGAATVFNTDTIYVRDVSASGSMGNRSPDIGTTFAPGFTDEPGGSDEIEIVLEYGSGQDGLVLFPGLSGPPASHFLTVGRGLLNLNADETDGVDADVTMEGADYVTVFLNEAYGGTAADEVQADGGGGTGAAPYAGELSVIGGPGADLLVGGSGEDYLAGEAGADRMLGGDARDEVKGGAGADRLVGQRGRDSLQGEAGNDHHDGGPVRDFCSGGGGRDSYASCEEGRG